MKEIKETYQGGWQTHPGTYYGHYFAAGEVLSHCRKIHRAIGGEVLNDCLKKCTDCQKKLELPQTPNMFAEIE